MQLEPFNAKVPIQLCRQYADAILHNARSIGLQVTYDKATPTDGNCFYHAVIESLSYYGINFQGTHHLERKWSIMSAKMKIWLLFKHIS